MRPTRSWVGACWSATRRFPSRSGRSCGVRRRSCRSRRSSGFPGPGRPGPGPRSGARSIWPSSSPRSATSSGTGRSPACRPRGPQSFSTSSRSWERCWVPSCWASRSRSSRSRAASWSSPVWSSRSGPAPGDCILEVVAEPRRYQLQKDDANRLIADLLDAEDVPAERRGFYQQLLTTALKLHEDGAGTGDLKITNTALKELRYAYKVFAPGAGAGIMGAAQEGAGGEQSFGLNIRLPFEQEANPWIASDPKLITFKYFFTRKLFLVKEASAIALFPGGFGTMDEAFEVLTLMQTGKATIVPMVLVETDQTPYWRKWDAFVRETLAAQNLIDPIDASFYRIVDTVDEAVEHLTSFYRVYHSSRIVGDNLVFRLNRALRDSDLAQIQQRFEDVLKGRVDQAPGPYPQEYNEYPDLPRLLVPFNRTSYARLRQLIDFVNTL